MKKYLNLFISIFFASILAGCNEEDNENMVWELISNSDIEMIEVAIDTPADFKTPSNIWVNAGYKSGDIVLRCKNHPVSFSLDSQFDCYENKEMGFSISKEDDYTLKIHFDMDASGKTEETDQITICNADKKPIVCNTFIWITRSFGEINPEPQGMPDKYKFKIAKSGFSPFMHDDFHTPAPFDNLTFEIRDYLDRYYLLFPEFLEPYDSIVWSAKDMPDSVRVYEQESDEVHSEKHYKPQWSTHFFKGGNIMTYLKGYKDGNVIYSDSLRVDIYERDFLCFDWKNGSVSLLNTGTTGVYCLLDNSREYNVVHTREANGTRYVEIHAWNQHAVPNNEFLSISKDVLRKLMKENIGEGRSAENLTGEFKCIPAGMNAEEFWENKTTRILLLHELHSDYHDEAYHLHVESK